MSEAPRGVELPGESPSGERYSFGDRTFSRADIKQDLSRQLERYENAAVQLQAREKLLATRRQTLLAAGEKIRQYQRNHDALVEKSEALRGELKLAELAADAHQIDFDHSKFQAAKTLAEEVGQRIRTVQRLIGGQTVGGDIPVDADSRPVSRRFDGKLPRLQLGQPTSLFQRCQRVVAANERQWHRPTDSL